MPRRVRKGDSTESAQGKGVIDNEHAIATRVQAIYKKIISTLQNQRDLRCDLANTRTRSTVLAAEYIALHREYDKSAATHNKIFDLSRELARQNKAIEEDVEQRISHERQLSQAAALRFNTITKDFNNKIACETLSRQQHDAYVANMQNKVADLRERNDMRDLHFTQQLHCKKLETQLAQAKCCQLDRQHATLRLQLSDFSQQFSHVEAEQSHINHTLLRLREDIRRNNAFMTDSEPQFSANKERIETLQANIKGMQQAIVTGRNSSSAMLLHIKIMNAECARLKLTATEYQEAEQKERTKIDTLEKLCRQVTAERTGVHNDFIAMQVAWTKLKNDINTLKDQVGDNGKVFEMLRSIMNREILDFGAILKNEKSIEDAINDELSQLRLTSGAELNIRTSVSGSAATATPASSARSAEAPG